MSFVLTEVTHDGIFHADEVFASAVLRMLYTEVIILRTRDQVVIDRGNVVIDVGGKYNPELGQFDHHQGDFTLKHDNGIPYSSFGLIWKEHGRNLTYNDYAYKLIENGLVSSIDAIDNGIFPGDDRYDLVTVNTIISQMNSREPYKKEQQEHFNKAVNMAYIILSNALDNANELGKDYAVIKTIFEQHTNNGVVILDKYMNFREVVKNYPEVHYVIFKANDGWRAIATNEKYNVKPFTSEDPDFIFCHKNGFTFGTKTKELTLSLLQSVRVD